MSVSISCTPLVAYPVQPVPRALGQLIASPMRARGAQSFKSKHVTRDLPILMIPFGIFLEATAERVKSAGALNREGERF